MSEVPGPVLFARYAFPPNLHGYCGPDDHTTFFERAATGSDDPTLRHMSRQFDGAWPYLSLIAETHGVDDPLDPRVVAAYWVGSSLLDQFSTSEGRAAMHARFGGMVGTPLCALTEPALARSIPHHSFAVLCIYPWTAVLHEEGARAAMALQVLDRCRIRTGTVVEVSGDSVRAASSPLTWDGTRLALGPVETETVVTGQDGVSLLGELRAGDHVALHWEWVCGRLSREERDDLERYSAHQLEVVNEDVLPALRPASAR